MYHLSRPLLVLFFVKQDHLAESYSFLFSSIPQNSTKIFYVLHHHHEDIRKVIQLFSVPFCLFSSYRDYFVLPCNKILTYFQSNPSHKLFFFLNFLSQHPKFHSLVKKDDEKKKFCNVCRRLLTDNNDLSCQGICFVHFSRVI